MAPDSFGMDNSHNRFGRGCILVFDIHIICVCIYNGRNTEDTTGVTEVVIFFFNMYVCMHIFLYLVCIIVYSWYVYIYLVCIDVYTWYVYMYVYVYTYS